MALESNSSKRPQRDMVAFAPLSDGRTQFGKYELLGRIAAGGMAEIFRARFSAAAGVTKQVVIKRILPHYAANKSFIQMFTNEASIAMGLSHGNIAQVFDFGEIEGDWFLAMEYVDGQPLSKVMKRAKAMSIPVLPTQVACFICIELLKGLHYAHTRLDESGKPLRIIHRDVSPQNILISFEGQVKIVDFGIAKARNASGREETEAGAVKGKYTYFAPEQARGKEIDARTDVFAAGIVLYEMVCGQLPFQGKMIDTLSKIVRGEFAAPSSLNPDVDPALEEIILTAMALDKERRYQSAEAFHQALSTYLYQTTPAYQASHLPHMMAYLFEAELVSEGRPTQLPREFLEQVASWRKTMPTPSPAPQSGELKTANARGAARDPSTDREQAQSSRRQLFKKVATVALPVAAALAAAIAVLTFGRLSTFAVKVTSTPSQALVRVDHQLALDPTPLVLSELDASQAHLIEVSAPGMMPWHQVVEPKRGELVTLHAELVPELKPVVAPKVVEAPKPAPAEASWPLEHFSVSAAAQAFMVAKELPHVVLDEQKTYRVWSESRIWVGGHSTQECVYFLQGGTAADSFGLIGPKPVTIKGARALYAFVAAAKGDSTGALKVKVREVKSGPIQTLIVDTQAASFTPSPTERFLVTGLNPNSTYTLLLSPSAAVARTRGDPGGPVDQVLYGQSASGKQSAQGLLRVGKPKRVTGTSWFWLSMPDEQLADNAGGFEVELHEGRPTSLKR